MIREPLSQLLFSAMILSCTACPSVATNDTPTPAPQTAAMTTVVLSDSGVTVDGASASDDPGQAVYAGAGIVYYESGHDETYREGGGAAAHTVVTITQPGTYRTSGTLSLGQLAIDLGEDAAGATARPPPFL